MKSKVRSFVVILGFIFFIAMAWYFGNKIFNNEGADHADNSELQEEADPSIKNTPSEQEQYGEKIENKDSKASSQEVEQIDPMNKIYINYILEEINKCFTSEEEVEISNFSNPNESAISVSHEDMLQSLENKLGTIVNTSDRWMNWHYRNNEGRELRLRMEIFEDDDGRIVRELSKYSLDSEGLPIPLEKNRNLDNGKDDFSEKINQILSGAEILYKEKSGSVKFSEGAFLTFVEKNSSLSEFEVSFKNRLFRCENFSSSQSCQCSK